MKKDRATKPEQTKEERKADQLYVYSQMSEIRRFAQDFPHLRLQMIATIINAVK